MRCSAITAGHSGEFVFKGGTSLEKLRIIERFSEDLDLLVVGDFVTVRAAKRAMKAMLDTAASLTGGVYQDRVSGGTLGVATQQARLELPLGCGDPSSGIADPTSVLIELGQSGGPSPSLKAPAESLLSRELKGSIDGEWEDLPAFEVTILHPGRTSTPSASSPGCCEESMTWQ